MIKEAKTNTTKPVHDGNRGAKVEFRTGPHPKGPARCLKCWKPFKPGDNWRRMTSPDDPKHGSYSIGIHTSCEGPERKQ
jgi:hypothetical protein